MLTSLAPVPCLPRRGQLDSADGTTERCHRKSLRWPGPSVEERNEVDCSVPGAAVAVAVRRGAARGWARGAGGAARGAGGAARGASAALEVDGQVHVVVPRRVGRFHHSAAVLHKYMLSITDDTLLDRYLSLVKRAKTETESVRYSSLAVCGLGGYITL